MSTYQQSVATNTCGDLPPCSSFISPIDAALTCTPIGDFTQGGFPIAGGRLEIRLASDPCYPSTIPSLNLCFQGSKQIAFCAADPAIGQEYNPKEFITKYGYFSTPTSIQGTAGQFRWSAKLTVPDQTHITVEILIEFLNQVAGINEWNTWISTTQTLDLQGPYVKNQGLAYKSNPEFVPITPTGAGPNCEVSYMSIIAGLQPLRYACGTSEGDVDTCGFWNGDYYYTCFRGEVIDKTGASLPVPFLMALNASNCATLSSCGCDRCKVTTTYYDCLYNTDATFYQYVLTNFAEPVDVDQQIQVANGAPFPIQIKFLNNTLWFYWAPNFPTWERSTGTLVQSYGPTIYTVEDTRYKIIFYSTRYPSPEIVPDCTTINFTSVSLTPAISAATAIPPAPKSLREAIAARASGSGKHCGCGGKTVNNWHPPKKS